uniref:GntR family transcriptional regulator n=1 Tax=Nonomuraea bangladeshensis TaxID=404385 RepID=UPI003F49394A
MRRHERLRAPPVQGEVPARTVEIKALLLNLVDSLPEGAALPSERWLADRWQVVRMTLRRAHRRARPGKAPGQTARERCTSPSSRWPSC